MPDFSITDTLGSPVDGVKVDWTSASSLFNYVKSEVLHLIVLPDFLAMKDEGLAQAAAKPASFKLQIGHGFQIGNITPEVDISPGTEIGLDINASADSDLLGDDSFPIQVTVAAQTGYVGMAVTGSLDLGVSGAAGDFTFGVDANQSLCVEFLKAFPLGATQPTLGEATGQMLSSYVIPASVSDLARLQTGDVCTVSGQGCLTVSGGFDITTPVNPLASVKLPLGAGEIDVIDGAMAGVTASLAISGSLQMRARRLQSGAIELSYLKEHGTKFETDLTASAGVTVELGSIDLLTTLLGAISKTKIDPAMLAALSGDEKAAFQSAIKTGIDHSLQASLNLALSTMTDDEAAFQYELRPDLFDAATSAAVGRALKGDLSGLTALEGNIPPGGAIAPGVKILNSVLTRMKSQGATLNVNLLGIVNLISISKLVSQCEFLTGYADGDLTIKETASSQRIDAIVDPLDKEEALRKALFESVMVTTTYLVSKAVSLPVLKCGSMHFASKADTAAQDLNDYLNWFVALSLLSAAEKQQIVDGFPGGGTSSCVVRTDMDDAACESLFFNAAGDLRSEADYQEIGRAAMFALLDPADGDITRVRAQMLQNPLWQKAIEIGPSPSLKPILPLGQADPLMNVVLPDVIGDVYQICWWAEGMRKAGQALKQMRDFLAGRNPASLKDDADFAERRDQLQKHMAGVVSNSQMRFKEPWGIVTLYKTAIKPHASGYLKAGRLLVQR